MGAAIIERMMATRPMRGAALLAPVPPAGLLPVAARLAASHPELLRRTWSGSIRRACRPTS